MQPAYRSHRAAESLLTPPGGRSAPALAPKVLYCRQGLRQQCPAAPQTPPCPMQGHSTPLPPKPPQPLPPAGDPVHAQAWPWAPRLHLKLKASEWKPILQMQLRVWEEASPCISSRATLCPALLCQCPSGDCTVGGILTLLALTPAFPLQPSCGILASTHTGLLLSPPTKYARCCPPPGLCPDWAPAHR